MAENLTTENKDRRIGQKVFMSSEVINQYVKEQNNSGGNLKLFPNGDYTGIVEGITERKLNVKFSLKDGMTLNVLIPIDLSTIDSDKFFNN